MVRSAIRLRSNVDGLRRSRPPAGCYPRKGSWGSVGEMRVSATVSRCSSSGWWLNLLSGPNHRSQTSRALLAVTDPSRINRTRSSTSGACSSGGAPRSSNPSGSSPLTASWTSAQHCPLPAAADCVAAQSRPDGSHPLVPDSAPALGEHPCQRDGARVVSCAQWAREEHFQATLRDSVAQKHMRTAAELANVEPRLYTAASSPPITSEPGTRVWLRWAAGRVFGSGLCARAGRPGRPRQLPGPTRQAPDPARATPRPPRSRTTAPWRRG